MNVIRCIAAVVLLVGLSGCSREKSEAVVFAKVLKQQADALEAVNGQEKQFVANIGRWSSRIAFMGPENSDNGSAGRFLSAQTGLTQPLEAITRAIENAPANAPFLQTLRASIVDSLKKRTSFLTSFTGPLTTANQNISGFSFGVPAGIQEIKSIASAYSQPENAITKALLEIRTKYELSDSDLR